MQTRLSFLENRASCRSLTPLSNCSSNFDTVIEHSQCGPDTLNKNFGEDLNRITPSRFRFSTGTSRLLESLETEIKKLDYRFEFSRFDESPATIVACLQEACSFLISRTGTLGRWSNERRGDICSSCIKMKNLMDEAKFSIEREKESLENTEKHLKHYDSLLAIKENRLREQELAFDNERNLIEIEKSEISRERISNEKDRENIMREYRDINTEKDNLEKQIANIERKYQEVKRILSDFERQKSENSSRNDQIKEIELKEQQLKQKETEIDKKTEDVKNKARQLERSYKEKTGLFEKLKQEILNKEKIILKKKQKISELKQKPEKQGDKALMESQQRDLDQKELFFKNKTDELNNFQQRLVEEKNKLDLLIRSVNEEKQELDLELQSNRRVCQEKILQAQLAEEHFRERLAQIDSKEKKLDQMIEAFREEEEKLQERWKNIENIEKATTELQVTKEKMQSLHKCFLIQQQELNEYKAKGTPNFSYEIIDKIESIKKKEEELNDAEIQLNKEREEIEISAKLIRQLNEDLEKQKVFQKNEQTRLKNLEKELKSREIEAKENSRLEVEKSFKNSSFTSIQKILVSDMSPFEDKDFHLEGTL